MSSNQARNELILSLYRAECPIRDIALYVGVSYGTCYRLVRASDIPMRHRGRPKLVEAPYIKKPVDVLGEDYIPEFFTDLEKAEFLERKPAFFVTAPPNSGSRPVYDPEHLHIKPKSGNILVSLEAPPPPVSMAEEIEARMHGQSIGDSDLTEDTAS